MFTKAKMFIATTLIALFSSMMFVPLTTHAAGCGAGDGASFLKLIPTWHQYLEKDANCDIAKFDIPGDIWKVGLAIVDIILRLSGIVATIFIIRAGFAFVLSNGNPQQAAKARQSLIDALIGMAIASIAIVLVAFLGRTLA